MSNSVNCFSFALLKKIESYFNNSKYVHEKDDVNGGYREAKKFLVAGKEVIQGNEWSMQGILFLVLYKQFGNLISPMRFAPMIAPHRREYKICSLLFANKNKMHA